MSNPVGYVASKVFADFGDDAYPPVQIPPIVPKTEFILEPNPGMEIRHIVLISDVNATGAGLEWRLIQPGNDYDSEAILAIGKVSSFIANRREIFSTRTGTTGYHRPLIFRVTGYATPADIPVVTSIRAIENLTVSVEYSPEREYEIQGVSNA